MNKALVIMLFLLFFYLLLLCSCGGNFNVNVSDSKHEIVLVIDPIEIANQIKNECVENATTKEEILICIEDLINQIKEEQNESQEQ